MKRTRHGISSRNELAFTFRLDSAFRHMASSAHLARNSVGSAESALDVRDRDVHYLERAEDGLGRRDRDRKSEDRSRRSEAETGVSIADVELTEEIRTDAMPKL